MPPLTTDVEIDGAGYMLAPGTYKRTQDRMPEGRTGRVVVRDVFGGQRRALQLERDKGWDAVGVGPAYFGQAKEPTGGHRRVRSGQRRWAAIWGGARST